MYGLAILFIILVIGLKLAAYKTKKKVLVSVNNGVNTSIVYLSSGILFTMILSGLGLATVNPALTLFLLVAVVVGFIKGVLRTPKDDYE